MWGLLSQEDGGGEQGGRKGDWLDREEEDGREESAQAQEAAGK